MSLASGGSTCFFVDIAIFDHLRSHSSTTDYPGPVVGGKITMLIITCASTTATFKIDVRKKSANGLALRAFVHQWGITKLPHKCTVCSDNCGSMQLVRNEAHELGLAHEWTPPYSNSVNLSEKAIDIIIGAAGATCIIGGISSYYLPYVIIDVLNKLFISPTTVDRGFQSPHERIFAEQPSLSSHEASGTHVVVRKRIKNATVAHYDNKGLRGEQPELWSFEHQWTHTRLFASSCTWPLQSFIHSCLIKHLFPICVCVKRSFDPPLASDTFEHVDDVDGRENHCRSAAHGTADRPE